MLLVLVLYKISFPKQNTNICIYIRVRLSYTTGALAEQVILLPIRDNYVHAWLYILSGIRVALSYLFRVVFCRTLFSFRPFPLHCLCFDIQILVAPLTI